MNALNPSPSLVLFVLGIFLSVSTAKANHRPQISNQVATLHKIEKSIEIRFTLHDYEKDTIKVSLKVFDKNGVSYNTKGFRLTGDIGYPIITGDKRILIHFNQLPDISNLIIQIIAEDLIVEKIIAEVDTTRLKRDFKKIYGFRDAYSDSGRRHKGNVRSYLMKCFAENNLTLNNQRLFFSQTDFQKSFQEKFGLQPELGASTEQFEIVNIVANKTSVSQPNEIVLLTAHYDAIKGSPGADDNGSGVIGLLEVMRILAKHDFGRTIRFIAFDLEEHGSWGSLNYVFNGGIGSHEKVAAVINFDMIGTARTAPDSQELPDGFGEYFKEISDRIVANKRRGDFALSVSDENSALVSQIIAKASKQYVPALTLHSLVAAEDQLHDFELMSSDHAAFWLAGISAVHVGEGGPTRNKFIDSALDNGSDLKLDYQFISNVVRMTVAALVILAGTDQATTATIQSIR